MKSSTTQYRVHAKSYEQAAAQYAAEIGANNWHNCTSGDITRWQIGSKVFTIVAQSNQHIASSPEPHYRFGFVYVRAGLARNKRYRPWWATDS